MPSYTLPGGTIKFESEKTNGRYPAVAASGGGGGSTGTPSISSVTDNGDGTITVQGSGFGSKDQAAPVLYDFVTKAYENGQENTFQGTFFSDGQDLDAADNETNRIWDGVGGPNSTVPTTAGHYRTLAVNTRHSGVGAYYEIRDGAWFGQPIAYGGSDDNQPGDVRFDRPDGETQLYVAWWLWVNADPHNLYIMTVENVSGTFQTGDSYRRGEQVIITEGAAQGRDVIGWVHSYDSGTNEMIFENDTSADQDLYGPPNVYAIDGSPFTAQSSGTTGNLIDNDPNDDGESFTRSTSPNKYGRFWEQNGNEGLRATLAVQSGLYISGKTTTKYDTAYNVGGRSDLPSLSWSLIEVLIDKGDVDTATDGRAELWVNGKLKAGAYDIDPAYMDYDPSSPSMQLIGMNTGSFPGHDFRISEVVQDKTWQRCVIADADTLSAATHYEVQRPTDWNDTGITVEKVEGALSGASQLYVYVFNADGTPNDTGVAI